MSRIVFGTDGWRAVIADDYTFENVERVARATGQWVLRRHADNPFVLVGYDTRFLGHAFAERVAEVLGSMGIRVRLADAFVTTPAVSWGTRAYGCAAGIAITASHNPPQYNGFKIKLGHGGPADPATVAEVEAELGHLEGPFERRPAAALEREGLLERFNLRTAYLYALEDLVDVRAIRRSGLRVGVDPMYGAGQGVVSTLLGARQVVEIHAEHNPWMHGRAPEPIARNLEYFRRVVREERCDVGLAFDGDADRIGLVDETGAFVDSHKVLALLVKHLHEEKGLRGTIVRTFSTTDMLARMAEAYGLPLETTPVGFKYIAPKIVGGDVLVAGEESGGIAVRGHIPERDGILIGLTVLETMVARRKTLSELVAELQEAFGPLHYGREDLHTTPERKEAFLARLAAGEPTEVAGEPVRSREDLDGVKLRLDDGWLMFRASGTEPVLRIYAEASSPERVERLVAAGVALVEG